MGKKPKSKRMPSVFQQLVDSIGERRGTFTPTPKQDTFDWHNPDYIIPPEWVPKKSSLCKRLFRRSSQRKTPMESYEHHLERLIRDMRYVTHLAEHPDVQHACGFSNGYDSVRFLEWVLLNIYWLRDNAQFPPSEYMNEVGTLFIPSPTERFGRITIRPSEWKKEYTKMHEEREREREREREIERLRERVESLERAPPYHADFIES